MKTLFIFILVLLSNVVRSQSVEISFSLIESCVNISNQTQTIQIDIRNTTGKDIWIDLEAIKFTLYLEDTLLSPIETTTIGVYTPKDQISQSGFVLVRKKNNVSVINHTNLFKNYRLDNNKEYCLKGYYKEARNKKLKTIYNSNKQIGSTFFKVCK